jgi:hypothetical protein
VNDVWINLRLGRVLLGKGRKQDALTYYQAALAAHPTAAVHGVIANLVQERAQYHEAVAHWREATRLKPDISTYYFCLGENLMYAYRYDEATRAFGRAMDLSMSDCTYVVNLAGVLSEDSLSKLPSEERQRWETSWRQIDALFGTEAKFLAKRGNWARLSPSTMTSTCDAELTRESDDSILVSGNPAPNDTYTIISVLDTGNITAFKLEVLADPRLPNRVPPVPKSQCVRRNERLGMTAFR